MRGIFLLFLPIYLLGVVYLSLPSPKITPLTNALKSDEPGDTYQNPDQSAYFTDYDRETVIKFYQDTFSLNLFGQRISPYRLNYRPEDTATYVRKHIETYYLEELVLPLRESLFISGWNPRLAPQNADLPDEERSKRMIVIYGQPFDAKITLKPYYSTLWAKLFVWTLLFPAGYLVVWQFNKSVKHLFKSLNA